VDRTSCHSRLYLSRLAPALLVLLLTPGTCQALSWVRSYGGASHDYGNSVLARPGWRTLFAGSTYSYGSSQPGAWLIEVDSNGDVLWERVYSGPRVATFSAAAATTDGGVILAGGLSEDPSTSVRCWLVRLNAAGDEIWQRGQDSTGGCYWRSVQETADRGYITAGWCPHSPTRDLCMAKLDFEGKMEWQKVLGRDSTFQEAETVRQTRDLGYVVVGVTDRGVGEYDLWVLRLDPSGNEVWSMTLGQPNVSDSGAAVVEAPDGDLIVAGGITLDGSPHAWLVRLDGTGTIRWQKAYDFLYAASRLTALYATEDGGFLAGGIGFQPIDNDMILLKVDAAGDVQWGGYSMWAGCDAIAPTGDGGFMVGGHTGLLTAGGRNDLWALRFDGQGLLDQDCSAFERIPVLSEETTAVPVPYTSPVQSFVLVPTTETLSQEPTAAVTAIQCVDCTPPEPSSRPSPQHLRVLGRDGPILVEGVPDATAYNLYVDLLGSWYFPTFPLGTACTVTDWTDNGDGTILLDHAIPMNSWIVASASNACGESGAGRDSAGQERREVGSWELCPLGP